MNVKGSISNKAWFDIKMVDVIKSGKQKNNQPFPSVVMMDKGPGFLPSVNVRFIGINDRVIVGVYFRSYGDRKRVEGSMRVRDNRYLYRYKWQLVTVGFLSHPKRLYQPGTEASPRKKKKFSSIGTSTGGPSGVPAPALTSATDPKGKGPKFAAPASL